MFISEAVTQLMILVLSWVITVTEFSSAKSTPPQKGIIPIESVVDKPAPSVTVNFMRQL